MTASYSLSPACRPAVPTQQPFVAGTDLVDAERQAAVGHVAAFSADQPPLAHLLPVVPGAAHGRPAVPVHFTPGTWAERKLVICLFSFSCFFPIKPVQSDKTEVIVLARTFLPVGDVAVAFSKHAAEASDALGVPPAVVALSPQGDAQTKVAVAGKAPPTGPVMVAHRLETRRRTIFQSLFII